MALQQRTAKAHRWATCHFARSLRLTPFNSCEPKPAFLFFDFEIAGRLLKALHYTKPNFCCYGNLLLLKSARTDPKMESPRDRQDHFIRQAAASEFSDVTELVNRLHAPPTTCELFQIELEHTVNTGGRRRWLGSNQEISPLLSELNSDRFRKDEEKPPLTVAVRILNWEHRKWIVRAHMAPTFVAFNPTN